MLVATLKGINLYNALTDNFERINKDTGEGEIVQNTLNCDFVNYYHIPTIPGSLSQNPVNAIYEDPSGVLWVGTVEGGLNRRAPGSNTFEHYTTDAPAHLSHNTVSCFTSDNDGRLWIGTWGGGIGWIDMKNIKPGLMKNIIAFI